MKEEDLKLGLKVFMASIVDVGAERIRDVLLLTEYTVTKAGKEFFAIQGKRGRLSGAYRNMGDTLSRLELTEMAAVENLLRRKTEGLVMHKDRYERKKAELKKHVEIIEDWKKVHG